MARFDWNFFAKALQQAGDKLSEQLMYEYNQKQTEQRTMRMMQENRTRQAKFDKQQAQWKSDIRMKEEDMLLDKKLKYNLELDERRRTIQAFWGSGDLKSMTMEALKPDAKLEQKIITTRIFDLQLKQGRLEPLTEQDYQFIRQYIPVDAQKGIADTERGNEKARRDLKLKELSEARQLQYMKSVFPQREIRTKIGREQLKGLQIKPTKEAGEARRKEEIRLSGVRKAAEKELRTVKEKLAKLEGESVYVRRTQKPLLDEYKSQISKLESAIERIGGKIPAQVKKPRKPTESYPLAKPGTKFEKGKIYRTQDGRLVKCVSITKQGPLFDEVKNF